ncbi:MAG: hypothetical protein ACI80V_001448 [Rhodothermales bacterium]|jgi:hypothetical protein
MTKLPICILVVAAGLSVLPASAQESNERAIRIEIKDGKVLVNGLAVDAEASDRLIIKKDDGKEVTVSIGDGEHTLWIGDDDGELHEPRHLRELLELRGDGVGNVFFSDGDDDHQFRVRSGDGNAFVWESDGAKPYQELLEGRRAGAREALRMGPMGFPGMDNREVMEMERKINELARRTRRTEGDKRTKLEGELDDLLAETFDLKHEAARAEASKLEEHLAEMRTRVSERQSSRAAIIARHKKQLMGERDTLDW